MSEIAFQFILSWIYIYIYIWCYLIYGFFSLFPFLSEILDLSHNGLGTMIPEEIGFFTLLQDLNLSENFLTGTIPSILAKLVELGKGQ